MKRRNFIKNSLVGTMIPNEYIKLFSGINGENFLELKKHKITRAERLKFSYNWPRHVGKNARKGNHGQYHSDDDYKLSPILKYWGISICVLTSMLILYFR